MASGDGRSGRSSGGASTWLPDDAAAPSGETARSRGVGPDERFERLALLGRGGMGEVWRARDLDLGRIVAMKILRPEVSHSLAGRFLTEARATAALEHPGIVPVHEVGRLSDGRPYYTMQEIRGTTLRERIREVHRATGPGAWASTPEGWTLRRLVESFHQVCEIVAYAHVRGVIHRDLKPDNVMLGDFGEVRVVDWGLVKVVGDSTGGDLGPSPAGPELSGSTLHGQTAGTVGYMPPEQAEGQLDRLSPQSDVYALGGVLSCVLTGRSPQRQGPDPDALAHPRVPPELRSLCLRSMQPEQERRPADAGELAGALRTWLDETAARAQHEALLDRAEAAFLALPPTTRERAREVLLSLVDAEGATAPRPVVELDADVVAILIDVGVLSLTEERAALADPALEDWPRLRAWIVADREGQRIRRELAVAAAGWSRRGERPGDLWRGELLVRALRWREQRVPLLARSEGRFLEESARTAGRRRTLRQLLVAAFALALVLATGISTSLYLQAEDARAAEVDALRQAEGRALVAEGARLRMAGRQHAAMVMDMAHHEVHPEHRADEQAHLLAASLGGRVERRLSAPQGPLWSADGALLAVLCGDHSLRILDDAGGELQRLHGVARVAWEPSGDRLAVLQRDGALLLGPPDALAELGSYPGRSLAWTQDGLMLADEAEELVLDDQGVVLARLPRAGRMDAALSDDGLHETWTEDGLVVRSLVDGGVLRLPQVSSSAVFGFRRDLQRLWVGDQLGTVHLYGPHGEQVGRLPGSGPGVATAEASPDGRWLAVGGFDNRVRVVDLATGQAPVVFEGHDRPVYSIAFSPRGDLVASGGGDDEVLLWEADSGRIVARLGAVPPSVRALAFSPDGRSLAVSAGDRLLTWTPAAAPTAAVPRCVGGRVEVDPTGEHLLTIGRGKACETDLARLSLRELPGVRHLEPSPGARRLVGLQGEQVVEVDHDQPTRDLELPVSGAQSVHLDPRGDLVWVSREGVLQGGADDDAWALVLHGWPGWHQHEPGSRYLSYLDTAGRLVIVDVVEGRTLLTVEADMVSPLNIAWVLDANRLVVGDMAGRIRSWDLRTPDVGGTVVDASFDAPVSALALRGTVLAASDGQGHLRVVDGRVGLVDLDLGGASVATSLHFSPDGSKLLVGIDHAALSVLDLATGRSLLEVDRGQRGLLHTLAWTADGRVLGVGTDDAWLWELPAQAPDPLELTNLRVCRRSLAVVPVARPGAGEPWAPAAACRGIPTPEEG